MIAEIRLQYAVLIKAFHLHHPLMTIADYHPRLAQSEIRQQRLHQDGLLVNALLRLFHQQYPHAPLE